MPKVCTQPEGTRITVTADGQEIVPCVSSPMHGVTKDGRVFRIVRGAFGREVPYELKTYKSTNKMGYLQVGGKGWVGTRLVHRLVAQAFVPNPDGLSDAAHNNGDVLDNRAENLRWTSRADNCLDKYAHGTAWLGTKHKQAKLTEDAVLQIRAGTLSFAEAKETFGISRGTFNWVLRGIGWVHIGGIHRSTLEARNGR